MQGGKSVGECECECEYNEGENHDNHGKNPNGPRSFRERFPCAIEYRRLHEHGSDKPLRHLIGSQRLNSSHDVILSKLSIAEFARIGPTPLHAVRNCTLQFGAVGQASNKGQLSAATDRLVSCPLLQFVFDPASRQPCVRGFMHNYCREFFDSRGRVGHESLVKDTGVQRPLIVGNLAGPYCYPNSFKLADDACIVQGTILLDQRQRVFNARQLHCRTLKASDPKAVKAAGRGHRQTNSLEEAWASRGRLVAFPAHRELGPVARPAARVVTGPRIRAFAGPVGPAERQAANKLNDEERDDGKSHDVEDGFPPRAPSPRRRKGPSWSPGAVWPYTTNKRSVCVWRHTTKTDPGDRAPAGAGTSTQDGLTRGDGHGPLKPHPSAAPSANDRVAEKF